jgi:hypothetical protein
VHIVYKSTVILAASFDMHERIFNPYRLSQPAPSDLFSIFMDSTYKDTQAAIVCTRTRGANIKQWAPAATPSNSTVSAVKNKTPATSCRRTIVAEKTTVSKATNAQKSPHKSASSCTTALARAQEVLLDNDISSQTTSIVTITTTDDFVLVTHSDLPVADTNDEKDHDFVLIFS